MPAARVVLLTLIAMLAFAGNSLLCRLALRNEAIDAATFTAIRILSGALALWLIVQISRRNTSRAGTWPSALALFVYAAAFSFAYLELTAATGALLLFGAVQVSMLGYGVFKGERLQALQVGGIALAAAGFVALLLPGFTAPPVLPASLMIAAGVAWGIYSLRGRDAGDPTQATAGNFLRASVPALLLTLATLRWQYLSIAGVMYAIASGAVTSGMGYAVWYAAVPHLRAASAATVQLSVPVVTALGGVVLLHEALTWRLVLSATLVLGGIALVTLTERR